MTQPLDFTRRITRRRAHPLPPRPRLADRALMLSCGLLRANGAVVLEHDWRHHDRRLGVIAREGGTLCFVAVLTRGDFCHASPERISNGPARIRLRAAAGEWLRIADTRTPACALRFDLISAVLGPDGSFDLRHHKGVA
ncbi:MAG: YraN family protein [Segniliparus sp.]|uniref:YraN family protein n=1 Tax=Segniliparus sp. TaxID=2804064 RepID=UPI003F3B1FDA